MLSFPESASRKSVSKKDREDFQVFLQEAIELPIPGGCPSLCILGSGGCDTIRVVATLRGYYAVRVSADNTGTQTEERP